VRCGKWQGTGRIASCYFFVHGLDHERFKEAQQASVGNGLAHLFDFTVHLLMLAT
jgi:hypothetical protein